MYRFSESIRRPHTRTVAAFWQFRTRCASRRMNTFISNAGLISGDRSLPHVLDPRCRLLYSVDKRPPVQPDERGINFEYQNNSSQRMVATLARYVTATYLAKVRTFDMDASELTTCHIPEKPDLVLIDAEHTNVAAFRDFINGCLSRPFLDGVRFSRC